MRKKMAQVVRTKASSSREAKPEKKEDRAPPLETRALANIEEIIDDEACKNSFSFMSTSPWDYTEEDSSSWDFDEDPAVFFPNSVLV